MLQLRRPQSAATAVSVTTSLVVVLLAVAVPGTMSGPPPKELRCWMTTFNNPKDPEAAARAYTCNPGDRCLYSTTFGKGDLYPAKHCASPEMCAKEIAKRRWDNFVECCDTDLCNDKTLVMLPRPRPKEHYENHSQDDIPDNCEYTATTAVHANTTVQQNLTTTEATILSTANTTQPLPASNTSAVRPTTTSQQSTTTSDHTSVASQSTSGKLTSIPAPASNTSSETSPRTSSTDATVSSTATEATPNSMFYAWIALMGVGVVGAVISAVLFVLTFRGIICAPKPSPGSDVVTKELDKTLV